MRGKKIVSGQAGSVGIEGRLILQPVKQADIDQRHGEADAGEAQKGRARARGEHTPSK